MKITYIGPHDEVTISTGQNCKQGDTIDVPDVVAGRAPEDEDPGEGLLAQATNWQAPTAGKSKRKDAE